MATIGSLYNFYLLQLESEPGYRLRRILKTVTEVIKQTKRDIARLEKQFGNEYGFDDWVADEWRFTDDLLGISFVACQVHITEIVSGLKNLHDLVLKRERGGVLLTTTDGTRPGIMRYRFTSTRRNAYSKVEVIDSLANYYKHSDEWPRDWSALTGGAVHTAAVVRQAGLRSRSGDNLSRGARYLGNKDGGSPEAYMKILEKWRTRLIRAYRAELVRHRLHPTRRRKAKP